MSNLFIDLLGEHEHIVQAVRAHLLEQLRSNLHLKYSPRPCTDLQTNIATTELPGLFIDCYSNSLGNRAANNLANASDWLHKAPSLGALNRILFLICPTEFASEDEKPLEIWRTLIEQSEIKRASLKSNSPFKQSLQIIRGFWESPATPGLEHSLLLRNAAYAFANVTQHLIKKINTEDNKTERFRPIPLSRNNYNFVACEKCSDPECEHKLFGFLNSGQL